MTLLERPFLLLTVYNSSLSLPAPYLPKFSWEHFLKKPLTNFFAVWYYIILIEVNKTYGDISMGAQIPDPSINLKFLIIKRAWVLIWKSGCQVLMSSHFQQSFFKRTDQGLSSALQAKIKIAKVGFRVWPCLHLAAWAYRLDDKRNYIYKVKTQTAFTPSTTATKSLINIILFICCERV